MVYKYDNKEFTFKVGGYFKANTDDRFYLIRGFDKEGSMWLDVFDIVDGVGVLRIKEPSYGYTPEGFKWRLSNDDIKFTDTPPVPIAITEEKPVVERVKPPSVKEVTTKTVKKTKSKPPPETGSLF